MSDFLLFTAGFFIALFYAWKISKEKLYSERVVFDAVILSSIFAAVGSRVFYVLFHFQDFGFNILKWIVFGLYPGQSIGGAILGAGAALWVLSDKKTVVPFQELVDVLSRTFLFVASVLLVAFAFTSPEIGHSFTFSLPILHNTHPITLYRLVNVVGIIVLMAVIFTKKRRLAPGTYSAVVWLLFIVGHFLIDFGKPHDVYYWKLGVDQWVYGVLILIVGIILAFQVKQKKFFQQK
jgi:prolipoprotein diacylglyceryltransferase